MEAALVHDKERAAWLNMGQAVSRIGTDTLTSKLGAIYLTMLEVVLKDRGRRGWDWRVRDHSDRTLLAGREKTRQAAKYMGDRALFQLLAANPKDIDLHKPT